MGLKTNTSQYWRKAWKTELQHDRESGKGASRNYRTQLKPYETNVCSLQRKWQHSITNDFLCTTNNLLVAYEQTLTMKLFARIVCKLPKHCF